MKKIIYIITILLIGTQLILSCSSSNEITNQFTKRKYLKNHKKNIRIVEEEFRSKVNYDASTRIDLACFEMKELEEIDLSEMPELISEHLLPIGKLKFLSKENFSIEPEPRQCDYIANNYVEDEEEKEALKKKAKGSLFFGILGIPLSFTLFAPLLAIITGVKVVRRARMNLNDDNIKNKTWASIGIVLGIIGVLLFHVIIISYLNTISV